MRGAFDLFDDDDDLRCAVLTGEGPAFYADGDLKEMAAQAVTVPPTEWGRLLSSRGFVSKTVVAAVNGPALAGGFRLGPKTVIFAWQTRARRSASAS